MKHVSVSFCVFVCFCRTRDVSFVFYEPLNASGKTVFSQVDGVIVFLFHSDYNIKYSLIKVTDS